ncbi:unnamed protein product, partial [Symbiodinium sp. CCMP2456]
MQGPTAGEISSSFDSWWLDEGQSMLSKGRRMRAPRNQDDEDDFIEEYLEDMQEDEGDVCEDEKLIDLIAAEDHAKTKHALQELTESLAPSAEAAAVVPAESGLGDCQSQLVPAESGSGDCPAAESAPAEEAVVASGPLPAEPSLQLLMQDFLDHPDFQHGDSRATNMACLKRAEALMPAIRQMAVDTRARESQLSHAQLTGSSKYSSSWHQDQHVLAVRRAQSMLSGARTSRQAAWFAVQQKATGVNMLKDTGCNEHLKPLAQMRPPSKATDPDDIDESDQVEDAATVEGPKVYSVQDFTRGKINNLLEFLECLPAQFKEKGLDLVGEAKKKGYTWAHIVKRSPDYFDVLLPPGPGCSSKQYSKGVVGKLLQLQAGDTKTILKFCKDVDELAQPML